MASKWELDLNRNFDFKTHVHTQNTKMLVIYAVAAAAAYWHGKMIMEKYWVKE